MSYDQIGKVLIGIGVVIVVVGVLVFLLARVTPLGRLPGDFSFTSGNLTCFVPLATMLVLSIILTIVLNIVVRILNR